MRRSGGRVLAFALVVSTVLAALPADVARDLPEPVRSLLPAPAAAAGEQVTSPAYVSATVLPNGQVGLLYANGSNGVDTAAEIRFVSYVSEKAINPSMQLSTAGGLYPQLATYRGKVVAAYVDSRAGPNQGKLAVRTSDDNGATWGAESYPLGADTFVWAHAYAPLVIATRDQQTLHVFKASGGTIPQYRSTTDPALLSWTAWSAAGDASMAVASGTGFGAVCEEEVARTHAFGFM